MAKAPRKKPIDPLDAAAQLFRKQGFAATTVRQIAQAAGMLPRSHHYRYPSKEAILVALMERAVERSMTAVGQAIVDCDDPLDRMRLALRAHLHLLVSGDDAVYVLLYDWRSLEGEAQKQMLRLRERYEGFWDALLAKGVEQGMVRHGVDPILVRLLGFGAVNWVAQWYEPNGPYSTDQIADAFWSFTAFGVLAEPMRKKRLKG
jgi:AcrR family transcriptional regulator